LHPASATKCDYVFWQAIYEQTHFDIIRRVDIIYSGSGRHDPFGWKHDSIECSAEHSVLWSGWQAGEGCQTGSDTIGTRCAGGDRARRSDQSSALTSHRQITYSSYGCFSF